MIDQFGHSSGAAIRHYGRSKNPRRGIDGSMMGAFLEASRKWQKMVKIGEETFLVIHDEDEMWFKPGPSQPGVQNRKRGLSKTARDTMKLVEEDPTDPVSLNVKKQRLGEDQMIAKQVGSYGRSRRGRNLSTIFSLHNIR